MENVYRNQTSTMAKIQMIASLRITTVPEAVAYLRAMGPVNDQIAAILQRASIAQQQALNKTRTETTETTETTGTKEEETTPTEVVPDAPKKFEAEDLSSDEGYSEKEVKEKVAKLKKAKEEK